MSRQLLEVWKSPVLWLIVLAVLAVPLLADFNTRLAYSRAMTTEAADLQKEIDVERARQTALEEFKVYVQSDAYVEHWARQSRLSKEGEIPVIPVPAQSAAAAVASPPPSPPNTVGSEWGALLFQ